MDQRFKLLCQSQRISLSELARRSKITPGYLSKILNDKTPNVSLIVQYKAHSLTERRLKAKILFGIASIYLGKGEYRKALILLRKSLMTWDTGVHAGTVYLNMGTLNRRNGDYRSAELCYRSALLIPVDFIQLLAYAGLGQLYMDQKKLFEARSILLQGYCIARNTLEVRGKGELFCNLGKYYNERNLPEKALRVLKRGLDFTTNPSSKRTRLYLLTEIINTSISLNQAEEIEPIIEKLHLENINEGDILLVSTNLLTHAKKHLHENHFSQALPILNQCYRLLTPVSPTQELMTCCHLLSECYFQLKEPFQSDFYIRESKRLRKALKNQKA